MNTRAGIWKGLLCGGVVLGFLLPAMAETVTLPAGTKIQVVLETWLSTRDTKEGDSFRSRLVMPVFVNEREVLPVGCVVEGTVVNVEKPGRVAGKPEIQLSPETLSFPDGRTVPLTASITDAQTGDEVKVDSEEGTLSGSGKEGMNTRQVATGAATSAVIGGVMAGGKGAAIGAGAVGAIALLHQIFKRGKDMELPAGSEIELELNRPISFTALGEISQPRRLTRDRD